MVDQWGGTPIVPEGKVESHQAAYGSAPMPPEYRLGTGSRVVCPVCNKSFATQASLNGHMAAHRRKASADAEGIHEGTGEDPEYIGLGVSTLGEPGEG